MDRFDAVSETAEMAERIGFEAAESRPDRCQHTTHACCKSPGEASAHQIDVEPVSRKRGRERSCEIVDLFGFEIHRDTVADHEGWRVGGQRGKDIAAQLLVLEADGDPLQRIWAGSDRRDGILALNDRPLVDFGAASAGNPEGTRIETRADQGDRHIRMAFSFARIASSIR
jgi:hypothetical protein